MLGISLSAEDVRNAPPEVRRWLQQGLASLFHLQSDRPVSEERTEHLVACSPDEAVGIFSAIREMPAAVNVFFELGREGEVAGAQGVVAHKLVDLLHGARLQAAEQLNACLQTINQAARAVRNDPGATLYVIDPRGYCLIAAATQTSIHEVWNRLVANQNLAGDGAATEPRPTFPEVHAVAAPDAMHMADGRAAFTA